VTETQPNAGATVASRRWTPEEDTKLTSAVTNIFKKKWGKEYKTDWVAVAAQVPGRTEIQCNSKWYDVLDPSIDHANRLTGKWVEDEDEDSKLKGAVETYWGCGKDWVAIVMLVPGRTQRQCYNRWRDTLDPSIDQMNGRAVIGQ
jgi:myb proto-oncogene protein